MSRWKLKFTTQQKPYKWKTNVSHGQEIKKRSDVCIPWINETRLWLKHRFWSILKNKTKLNSIFRQSVKEGLGEKIVIPTWRLKIDTREIDCRYVGQVSTLSYQIRTVRSTENMICEAAMSLLNRYHRMVTGENHYIAQPTVTLPFEIKWKTTPLLFPSSNIMAKTLIYDSIPHCGCLEIRFGRRSTSWTDYRV